MSEDNDWKVSGWQEAGGAALVFNAIGQASRERAMQGKLQEAVIATNDTNVLLRRFEIERSGKDRSIQALFSLWKSVNAISEDKTVEEDEVVKLIVLSRIIDQQRLGFFELIEFNRLQKRIIEIAKHSGLKDAVLLLANQQNIRAVDHNQFDSLVNAKYQRAKVEAGGVAHLSEAAINILKKYESRFLRDILEAYLSSASVKEAKLSLHLIDVFLELLQGLSNQDLLDSVYNKLADPKWPHNGPVRDFIKTNSLVDPERIVMLFQTGYTRAIQDGAALLFEPRLTWTAADALPLRKIIQIIQNGLAKPDPIEVVSFLGKKSQSVACAACSAKTDVNEASKVDQCPSCGAISFIIAHEGGKSNLIERLTRRVEVLEDLEREISI